MDGVDRNLALDSEESVDSCLNSLLSLFESRIICVCLRLCELVLEIVRKGDRKHEITVCETLHEG